MFAIQVQGGVKRPEFHSGFRIRKTGNEGKCLRDRNLIVLEEYGVLEVAP